LTKLRFALSRITNSDKGLPNGQLCAAEQSGTVDAEISAWPIQKDWKPNIGMADAKDWKPKDWKEVYEAVQLALDPAKQMQLCQQARRLMQRRMVELAAQEPIDHGEGEALEQALRTLWVLEQSIHKPKIQ
jgi:hypothetical protein